MSVQNLTLVTNIHINNLEFNKIQTRQGLSSKILKILNNKKKSMSTEKIGIIQNISEDDFIILKNMVSRDNKFLMFEVEVKLTSIKPFTDTYYTSKIVQVFEKGVFLFCNSPNIKVFIPVSVLNELNLFFNETNNTFSGVRVDDFLTYKVDSVQYYDNCFKCIGSI